MIFVLLLAACAASAARNPVTLDAVLETPRPGAAISIVWSPDGKFFAWQQGSVVRVYDVIARSEKELIDLKTLENSVQAPPEPEAFAWVNRGVRERRIQWTADASRLLLQVKGDLFLVHRETGASEQLTRTTETEHDPKLSPGSQKISFRRGHNLFVLDVASKKTVQLTSDGSSTRWNAELDWVYPEELSIDTAHWWSPDSKRIAYLQFDVSPVMLYPHGDLLKLRPVAEPQRYPQAGTPNSVVRLGLAPAGGGKTRWLDIPGAPQSLVARVTWLPDSAALAVHVANRVQNTLTLWRIAEPRPRKMLEDTDPAWINLRDDFAFLKNSPRLVWGAERPDFRHLYLHSTGGEGAPSAITSGSWEVTDLACVDEPARRVFYLSTEVSPLERHLYSASFDGNEKRRLTSEAGTHIISMAPGCRHYIATHSSLTQPPRRALFDAEGKELAVLSPRDRKALDEFEILPESIVSFQGSDGERFYARLIRPAGFDSSRKYPAIVQVYGGPHAQSVRDFWRGAGWDQYLAHRGFVIWQVDNRGSAGRGHKFESPLCRRFGKQELADQLEGVRHLISLGFVDPARIGINGWSYGGFMALYSLLHAPDTFRAGVSGAPVTDWRQYDTIYTERYLGLPQENEEGYRASSPVHHAANLRSKLMLVHNFEDDNVLFQHTLRMMDALQRANKPFEFQLYPQKSHAVGGPARRHMLEAMTSFFERHLGPHAGQ